MSGHAETVRAYIEAVPSTRSKRQRPDVLAALDALVAERDEALDALEVMRGGWAAHLDRTVRAEIERDEARAALATAQSQVVLLREALETWPQDGSVHEPGCLAERFDGEHPGPCDCFTAIAREALAGEGRTREQDSGGDGLSAVAVVEAARLPFRASFFVVFAADDPNHAWEAFEGMNGMLEAAGAIIEVGSVVQMALEDVIEDSPLAAALSTEAALKRPNQEVHGYCPACDNGLQCPDAAAQVREGETP